MDPITARAALHLPPVVPLTVEQIDAAHRAEVQTYHPARYVDRTQRAAAVAWVQALDAARATLLAEAARPAASPTTPTAAAAAAEWTAPSGPAYRAAVAPGGAPSDWAAAVAAGTAAGATQPPAGYVQVTPYVAPAQPPRRRIAPGWIIGIVAACVVLLALVVGIGFGAVALGERLATLAESAGDTTTDDEPTDEPVDHYSPAETMFTFPAALEFYFDGRYTDKCPAEYELGCWEAAVIPEAPCAIMTVSFAYAATEEQPEPDLVDSERFYDVAAGEIVPIVFGNDDFEYGWPLDVTCHSSAS
ncbi:hypothetical protein [Agromyces sp. NPDC058126]|uniref:hypothetical protein n=1 Tax=Agromyces sp. NPDC058126 TaxID=3346350 RepID=UPI0036DF803C